MIIYSFIIPHKNTSKLLARLLDSIPQRDDTEIIIVDDNSNPEIVDFSEFPGTTRQGVRCVFNKENRGAGYARNIGLRYARGRWVYFADSDDVFTENLSSLLDKYCDVSDVDMIFVNAKVLDDEGNIHDFVLNRYIRNYIKNRPNAFDVLRYGTWTPWSRMIRRKIFIDNNVQFEEVPIGNDTMGILNASRYSKTFAVEPETIYLYYKPNGGSQTKAAYVDSNYLQRLKLQFAINGFYGEVGYPYKWPMFPMLSKSRIDSNSIKEVKKENDYNPLMDCWNFVVYSFAKMRGIL